MRRMKGWILAALLCLLAAWSVGQAVLGGERPFRDLEGADITAASVALFPPGSRYAWGWTSSRRSASSTWRG